MTSLAETTQQARQSTSERPSGNTTAGPIQIFDWHLKMMNDTYLTFFTERLQVETAYIEALQQLHKKTRSVDAYYDEHNLSSVRRAWSEVRDNLERETQARQAFLTTLEVDAIKPLTAFKETQERTRKRIKEDLKESTAVYNDYAENTLPKLKRTYMRKCQDVEEYKLGSAGAAQGQPQFVTLPQSNDQPPLRSARGYGEVSSPLPLRSSDRRASGAGPRSRSPPFGGPSAGFSDLAHQGNLKKGLNQLIGFLDKNNSIKESHVGKSEVTALRAVRSKRDAEDADQEYRKGVHWVETLRLHRTKVLESAHTSLEEFVFEGAVAVKKIMERYTDNSITTSTMLTQLSTHTRSVIDKANPSQDREAISQFNARALAMAIPQRVVYVNYYVGDCPDLLFGINLTDYATTRGLNEGEIPKIVRLCITEIDARGLDAEGIYRVSGRHANVLELQHRIEKDEAKFAFNRMTDDIFAVSSLLKLYLRSLPDPVFKYAQQDRWHYSAEREIHNKNDFVLLRAKIRRLPPINQSTLKAIVEHLARVAQHQNTNKMDPHNLAIAFGSVIFGEEEVPKAENLLSMTSVKDYVMEDLIIHASTLFDGNTAPPLPAAPTGQVAHSYPLGSMHTKVASVPANQTVGIDFAPKMPKGPANSIHHSSRIANQSPSRPRQELPPRPLGVEPLDSFASHQRISALSADVIDHPTVIPHLAPPSGDSLSPTALTTPSTPSAANRDLITDAPTTPPKPPSASTKRISREQPRSLFLSE